MNFGNMGRALSSAGDAADAVRTTNRATDGIQSAAQAAARQPSPAPTRSALDASPDQAPLTLERRGNASEADDLPEGVEYPRADGGEAQGVDEDSFDLFLPMPPARTDQLRSTDNTPPDLDARNDSHGDLNRASSASSEFIEEGADDYAMGGFPGGFGPSDDIFNLSMPPNNTAAVQTPRSPAVNTDASPGTLDDSSISLPLDPNGRHTSGGSIDDLSSEFDYDSNATDTSNFDVYEDASSGSLVSTSPLISQVDTTANAAPLPFDEAVVEQMSENAHEYGEYFNGLNDKGRTTYEARNTPRGNAGETIAISSPREIPVELETITTNTTAAARNILNRFEAGAKSQGSLRVSTEKDAVNFENDVTDLLKGLERNRGRPSFTTSAVTEIRQALGMALEQADDIPAMEKRMFSPEIASSISSTRYANRLGEEVANGADAGRIASDWTAGHPPFEDIRAHNIEAFQSTFTKDNADTLLTSKFDSMSPAQKSEAIEQFGKDFTKNLGLQKKRVKLFEMANFANTHPNMQYGGIYKDINEALSPDFVRLKVGDPTPPDMPNTNGLATLRREENSRAFVQVDIFDEAVNSPTSELPISVMSHELVHAQQYFATSAYATVLNSYAFRALPTAERTKAMKEVLSTIGVDIDHARTVYLTGLDTRQVSIPGTNNQQALYKDTFSEGEAWDLQLEGMKHMSELTRADF